MTKCQYSVAVETKIIKAHLNGLVTLSLYTNFHLFIHALCQIYSETRRLSF
jgi:hypothetical protein